MIPEATSSGMGNLNYLICMLNLIKVPKRWCILVPTVLNFIGKTSIGNIWLITTCSKSSTLCLAYKMNVTLFFLLFFLFLFFFLLSAVRKPRYVRRERPSATSASNSVTVATGAVTKVYNVWPASKGHLWALFQDMNLSHSTVSLEDC